MPFGKYRGRSLKRLPLNYLQWLRTRNLYEPLCSEVECEWLRRRETVRPEPCARGGIYIAPENRELFRELISAGYRQTALRYHPDVGGRSEDMRRLNALLEKLREQL
jgi:hypothetical protein